MLQDLEQLMKEFLSSLEEMNTSPALANLKAAYLGKKGRLSEILKSLKDATPEERKTLGSRANRFKQEMLVKLEEKGKMLEFDEINEKLKKSWQDISLIDSLRDRGMQNAGYHPVSIIQREVEDIFISMGFDILDGPHIEDDYHNFEALNIPASHPARDMQDTFWFKDLKHLLRTHTSPIQVRGMEEHKPPFRFVGPGKVFRNEAIDASHEAAFHQIEGMMVGPDVSVANMIHFLRTLLSEIFHQEIDVRLRPGFFPFVEPGFELDYKCLLCGGKGCSVCKKVGWVEGLGCGMVHPNVLRYGGIDPDEFTGFAFGIGLDRLVMMRYHIDDIRHLHSGNLAFISQFRSF